MAHDLEMKFHHFLPKEVNFEKVRILTLDGTLAVKLGAEHLHTEVKDSQGQDDTDAKTDTPHCLQMVHSSCRQYDQEDRYGQRTSELLSHELLNLTI